MFNPTNCKNNKWVHTSQKIHERFYIKNLPPQRSPISNGRPCWVIMSVNDNCLNSHKIVSKVPALVTFCTDNTMTKSRGLNRKRRTHKKENKNVHKSPEH